MKKSFGVALLLAIIGTHAHAHTTSSHQQNIIGKWQCHSENEDMILNYTAEYHSNQQAIEKGVFDLKLDDLLLSYYLDSKSTYRIEGDQLISTLDDIRQFERKHSKQTLDQMQADELLADIDALFGDSIYDAIGDESRFQIRTLDSKTLILHDDSDDSLITCQRTK